MTCLSPFGCWYKFVGRQQFFTRERNIFANLTNIVIKFPLMRFCPRLIRLLGVRAIPSRHHRFFRHIVSKNLKNILHLLLEIKRSLPLDEITIDDIVSQAIDFYTRVAQIRLLISCASFYTRLHLDIQERLQEEMDRCLDEGNDEISSTNPPSRMEYMMMLETFRKYPGLIFVDQVFTRKFASPPIRWCNFISRRYRFSSLRWIMILNIFSSR